MDKEALGRVAYEVFQRRYCAGAVLANWGLLEPKLQDHWNAAAEAVLAAANKRPAHAAPATAPKPSIGRIVHFIDSRYVDEPNQVYAAIIVAVHDDASVNLSVFNEDGEIVPHYYIKFTDAPVGSEEADGKWTWPART